MASVSGGFFTLVALFLLGQSVIALTVQDHALGQQSSAYATTIDTQARFVRSQPRSDQIDKSPSPQVVRTSSHRARSDGSVLYVVRTWSGLWDTRLHAVMQTWGSLIDDSHLLIISDTGKDKDQKLVSGLPIHKVSLDECPSDATCGLSCRTAHALVDAWQHPGNWSWVFLVDDDHYIKPGAVEQAFARFDASAKVGAGCWGCGAGTYCNGLGGFCGGCGYGFSRTALNALIGGSAKEFRNFHNKTSHSKLSDGREDMATSCTARMKIPDLEIVKLGDMQDHPAPGDKLEREARKFKGFGWHHVSPEQMFEIHRVLNGA